MTHPIDEMIAMLEQPEAGTALISNSNPALTEALFALMEQFEVADQVIAFSICFALVCAGIEGESVPIEAERGIFITFEDRLRLHVAEIRAVYREALILRSHPDAPQMGGKKM